MFPDLIFSSQSQLNRERVARANVERLLRRTRRRRAQAMHSAEIIPLRTRVDPAAQAERLAS